MVQSHRGSTDAVNDLTSLTQARAPGAVQGQVLPAPSGTSYVLFKMI